MNTTLLVIVILVAVIAVGAATALYLSRGQSGRGQVMAPPRPPAAPPTVTPGAPTEEVPAEGPAVEEVVEAVPAPPAPPVAPPRLRDRLAKARSVVSGYVGSILSRSGIDDETWDEIEEALVRADVGVGATTELVDTLRQRARAESIREPGALIEALKAELKSQLAADRSLALPDCAGGDGGTGDGDGDGSGDGSTGRVPVWLFVGVNGVGKTTTIGKVGKRLSDDGCRVLMAAGDTFRAAAAEQLQTWAERSGAEFIRGDEGADPSSVIFDGVQAAAARGVDLVLADTAGRLHTKVNLMEELRKVRRVADRDPGQVVETLLVIDATTGQNGLQQARQFTEAVDVTGVVLTKLDGSAKGGIVFAIQRELGIPVKLVGLGEQAQDLIDFDSDEFVEGLLATD